MSEPINLTIIIGSTREGRFGPVVASWFASRARQHKGLVVEVVDLAEVTLPSESLTASVGAADAFVIVMPEYNHSYAGPLKAAIDSIKPEWSAKPVAFVSYGGVSGGLRAVEALRPVFCELQAMTIREAVSFANFWEKFDEAGQLKEPAGPEGAATALLDQLLWWALALREAKEIRPYAA